MARPSKTVTKGAALEPALRMWLDVIVRALVREYVAEADDMNIPEFWRASAMCEPSEETTRKAS